MFDARDNLQDKNVVAVGKRKMDSYLAGIRKRTLSADTTDSSENEDGEDGGVSPTYNFYGQGGKNHGKKNVKLARLGIMSELL